MKQQALTIGHVGIDLDFPAGIAESGVDAFGQARHQPALHPFTAGPHERLQPHPALFVAGCLIWRGITAEAENFLIHNEIDILGEALDQFLCFRERGASFECEVLVDAGQGEEFTQGPADPEVFFYADGV
jgi:hypothetical protein